MLNCGGVSAGRSLVAFYHLPVVNLHHIRVYLVKLLSLQQKTHHTHLLHFLFLQNSYKVLVEAQARTILRLSTHRRLWHNVNCQLRVDPRQFLERGRNDLWLEEGKGVPIVNRTHISTLVGSQA